MRVTGLEPGTEYTLEVEGVPAGPYLPASFRTLERPSGRLLATIATANDVHFGETECGRLGPPHEEIGPLCQSADGEPPYPETMNRAVVNEMRALDPRCGGREGRSHRSGERRRVRRVPGGIRGRSAIGCTTCAATTTR